MSTKPMAPAIDELAAHLPGRHARRAARAEPHAVPLSAEHMRRIRDFVEANLGSDIGLADLAGQVGLSPHYFSLLFKRSFGVSPYRYVVARRIERARRRLAARTVPISEIALELGFSDQSHFCRVFRAFFGTTPKRYRAQRRGAAAASAAGHGQARRAARRACPSGAMPR